MQITSVKNTGYLVVIVGSLAAIGAITFHKMEPKILYNPSASAPIGFYYLSGETSYGRGDFVAVMAPDEAQILAAKRRYVPNNTPLLKTIYGVSGDEICIKKDVVMINKNPVAQAQQYDSKGRLMPALKGCSILNDGAYFLLSTVIENSFDSRYFGPVDEADILGVATPLLIFSK